MGWLCVLILERCPYVGNFLWGPGLHYPLPSKIYVLVVGEGSFIWATFVLHSVGLTTEGRCDCLLVQLITKPCFLHRMLADAIWDQIIGYLAAQSGDH